MEKQRKTKMIVIISLLVAVIGLSVAYAAMSGLLSINGSANVDAANWDIHFANLSEAKTKGEASEKNRPDVAENGASITNINVSLNNPKDEVVYDVDLVNEGSINAEISNIVTPTFTEEQEKYLEFKVTYTNDGTELAIGDLLNKGQSKKVTITIRYRDDLDEEDLPDTTQNITLSYELTYTQTDKEEEVTTPPEEEQEMFIWDSPTVISGLTDYGIEQVKASNGHLEIPEGVTEIADGGTVDIDEDAFNFNGKGFSPFAIGNLDPNSEEDMVKIADSEINIIKSVSLPSTLKRIGNIAFIGCMYLTEINLPSGLQEIGDLTFALTGITGELVIPNSVTSLGIGAFNTTKITSLKIGTGLKEISASAFYDCQDLTGELVIPDNVKTIGNDAFYNTSITSISFGTGISTIESNAFMNCGELTGELYIPDNVETIGSYAFGLDAGYENKLTSISISKNTIYDSNSNAGSFTRKRPTPTIRE